MTGEEKPVSGGGREPLVMKVGEKVHLVIRGGGTYESADAIDLTEFAKTGKKVPTGEKLVSAAIVVCDPKDSDDVAVVSANIKPEGTVLGRSVLSFLQKDEDGKYWLKEQFFNVKGYLGLAERESKAGYEKKMQMLTWEPEGKAKGMPEEAETVGADQREDLTAEGETQI